MSGAPWCEPCRSYHPATTPHVHEMPVQVWIPRRLIDAVREAKGNALETEETALALAEYVLRQQGGP